MKILFIYTNDIQKKFGGAQRTLQAKNALEKTNEVYSYFINYNTNKYNIFLYSLFGILKGHYKDLIILKKLIKKEKFNIIFFDDCCNGFFIEYLKKRFPEMMFIVNYHNNEIKYYKNLFETNGILYYPLYRAAKRNQYKSIKYSDMNIFITKKDMEEIMPVNHNCFVIPATMEDKYIPSNLEISEPYHLFFGAGFYANVDAAKRIISEIAPKTNEKIVIAGNGMDIALKNETIPSNVTVLGFIDNVNNLFIGAKSFLAPITIGSGMKIKIIDALMRGKYVITTPFASIGYITSDKVFFISNSSEEMISCMESLKNTELFNQKSRELYEKYYNANCDEKYYEIVTTEYKNFIGSGK